MDILAHGLWAALGVTWLASRQPVKRCQAVAAVALSVLPDLLHVVPVLLWDLLDAGSLHRTLAYAIALPGSEPAMPPWVALWSHHLHCVMHSAVVAGAATLLLWRWRQTVGLPLAGWWLHIVIDVFTHSARYYASPVLYPFTQAGFDGLAWNTPWFLAVNYGVIMFCAFALWRSRA